METADLKETSRKIDENQEPPFGSLLFAPCAI